MLAPLLTEPDPVDSTEGKLDPLGAYAIADALAVRLVPGVRERQVHPRFLTTMALTHVVCRGFDDDVVAADGVSEPWQVFEWHVVEALVRTIKESSLLGGLPGRMKVGACIRDRIPLSAKRYLKTPSVFGFHGVYRALARELGLESGHFLDEFGLELLDVWESEQGLDGFHAGTSGFGTEWRKSLAKSVDDGLSAGHVSRSGGWSGWRFMADHLHHLEPGEKEARLIARRLLNDPVGHRGSVLAYLVSHDCRDLVEQVLADGYASEREFHRRLHPNADGSLKTLLDAIDVYEQFCRLLQDAFEDCLYSMTSARRRVPAKELAALESVGKATTDVAGLFEDLIDLLSPFDEAARFQEIFIDVSSRSDAEDWVVSLLEHHCRVQHRKPPHGKAPWFERFDDGTYAIRPGYMRYEGGLHADEYVHQYRLEPLLTFAGDLGMLRNGKA